MMYRYTKLEGKKYNTHNENARKRRNIIDTLKNNSFTIYERVNDDVDSNTFNTWIKNILIPKSSQNFVIIMDNAVFHKDHKPLFNEHSHKLKCTSSDSPDLSLIIHQ